METIAKEQEAKSDKRARGALDSQNARASFVKPLLDKKGWSVFKWAQEANLDYHTVSGYLNNETKPYPQTRKRMADSLGVPVENLPE
jgi:lambda repressor-like predicted transcriptional regulator